MAAGSSARQRCGPRALPVDGPRRDLPRAACGAAAGRPWAPLRGAWRHLPPAERYRPGGPVSRGGPEAATLGGSAPFPPRDPLWFCRCESPEDRAPAPLGPARRGAPGPLSGLGPAAGGASRGLGPSDSVDPVSRRLLPPEK